MSNKIGIDKQTIPQPAPTRWSQTYRGARRNSAKTAKVEWTEGFYSERHFASLRTNEFRRPNGM